MLECFYPVIKGKFNTYEIEKSGSRYRTPDCPSDPRVAFKSYSPWFSENILYVIIGSTSAYEKLIQKLKPSKEDSLGRSFFYLYNEHLEVRISPKSALFFCRISMQFQFFTSLEAWVHPAKPQRKYFRSRNKIWLRKLPFPFLQKFFFSQQFFKISTTWD